MLRCGLRAAVMQQASLTLVGEATTGPMALKLARETTPDLVVMDIHIPEMDGIETTRQMLALQPAIKVIMFSGETSRSFIDSALQAGACGYLSKTSALEELLQAIDAVMEGRLFLSSEVSAGILEDYRKSLAAVPEPPKPPLNDREKQLLKLVAEGRRNKEMADQLGVSVKSIEASRSRLMQKLGCASSADLIRYAIREGIAQP
jgi:DNA-binding NarL/FixJ family response regulator